METISFRGRPVTGLGDDPVASPAPVLHSDGDTVLGAVVGGAVLAALSTVDSIRGKHRGGGWATVAYTIGGAVVGGFIGRGMSAEPNPDYIAARSPAQLQPPPQGQ